MPGNTEEIGAAMAPAKAASAHAERENQGEQQWNIDTEGGSHLAVAGAGANHHADASLVDHEVHATRRWRDKQR